jgi:hypothetical protein
MTDVKNTAESGLANGTDVTAANSGFAGSTAFNGANAVTPGGGTIKFSSAHPFKGALSYEFAPVAGAACYVEWNTIATPTNAAAARAYWYSTGYPLTGQSIINIRSTTGGNSAVQLVIGVDGVISIVSDQSASVVWTSAGALSLSTHYRIEIGITNGTSTTGTLNVQTYLGDSTTPVANLSGTASGLNFGTFAIGTCRFGRVSGSGATTWPAKVYLDDIAFRTGSASLFGPSVANVAPTANAGADILTGVVGTPVSRTGTGTDPDGTISAYEWSVVSYPAGSTSPTLTGATTATVGFTPSASGIYVLQFRVQDDSGAWSAYSTLQVFVPGTVVRPYAISINGGGWVLTGPDLVSALTDGSAATFLKSSLATANPSIVRIRLDPMKTPGTFSLIPKGMLALAGTATLKMRLYEGTNLRKSWTLAAPTTTETANPSSLTTTEINTVGSWLQMDVELEIGA